jgi:hypothetical protein
MDRRTAQAVHEGDQVTFQGQTYKVRSIERAGLWEPYFELDEVGLISYHLVEQEQSEPAQAAAPS